MVIVQLFFAGLLVGNHGALGVVLGSLTLGELYNIMSATVTSCTVVIMVGFILSYLSVLNASLLQNLLDNIVLVVGTKLILKSSLGGSIVSALNSLSIMTC